MMSVPSARSGIASRSLSTRPQVALAVVRAAHRLEHPRRAGLQRQVDVLADRRALGHRRDHRLAEVLRMRAREADPLDAVDGVARAQQLAELGVEVGAQVAAPGVDVLAEQRDLPDAVARRAASPRRRSRRAGGSARARAPPGRCSTRTSSCSPSRPAPRPEAPLAVHRQVAREVLVRAEAATADAVAPGADPLAEVRDRARPERDVDERVELEDPLALRLGVAAADGDDELGVLAASARRRRRGRRRASCRASRGSCTC